MADSNESLPNPVENQSDRVNDEKETKTTVSISNSQSFSNNGEQIEENKAPQETQIIDNSSDKIELHSSSKENKLISGGDETVEPGIKQATSDPNEKDKAPTIDSTKQDKVPTVQNEIRSSKIDDGTGSKGDDVYEPIDPTSNSAVIQTVTYSGEQNRISSEQQIHSSEENGLNDEDKKEETKESEQDDSVSKKVNRSTSDCAPKDRKNEKEAEKKVPCGGTNPPIDPYDNAWKYLSKHNILHLFQVRLLSI